MAHLQREQIARIRESEYACPRQLHFPVDTLWLRLQIVLLWSDESYLVECSDNFKIRSVCTGCYHRIAMYSSYLSGVAVHGCGLELVRFRQSEFDVYLLKCSWLG